MPEQTISMKVDVPVGYTFRKIGVPATPKDLVVIQGKVRSWGSMATDDKKGWFTIVEPMRVPTFNVPEAAVDLHVCLQQTHKVIRRIEAESGDDETETLAAAVRAIVQIQEILLNRIERCQKKSHDCTERLKELLRVQRDAMDHSKRLSAEDFTKQVADVCIDLAAAVAQMTINR